MGVYFQVERSESRNREREKERRTQLQSRIEEDKEENNNEYKDQDDLRKHELDISSEELKVLQHFTLGEIRVAVKTCESTEGATRRGRRWIPMRFGTH